MVGINLLYHAGCILCGADLWWWEQDIPSWKEVRVKLIFGKGYLKILLWRRKREYSLFFWLKGAMSKAHDHNVDEKTYILWAVGNGMLEIRRVVKKYAFIWHKRWTAFDVPAGTEHRVQALSFAITFNACAGPLKMNVLEDFHPAHSNLSMF
jgi:hypothetical protein